MRNSDLLAQPSEDSVMQGAPLLEIRDLRVQFDTANGVVDAIDGIDLKIDHGEVVALVGESGSGKSMTALSITRLLPSKANLVSGSILLDGRDLLQLPESEMNRIRGAQIAMLFQQPKATLDPTSEVGVQVGEALRVHQGLPAGVAWKRSVELLAEVGIPEPELRARAYVHQLSGGMAQRIMIASAISTGPAVLVADEPTTALDATVQAQILGLLTSMVRQAGMSMLLITHDLGIVETVADRVVVMYAGRVVEDGRTEQVLTRPRHPYTEALLLSSQLIPDADGRLFALPGGLPTLRHSMVGCRFRERCRYADRVGLTAVCEAAEPGLETCGDDQHHARCWGVENGLIQIELPRAARE